MDEKDLLVQRLQAARFTPVRLRQGYEMRAVDELLDRLVEAVRSGDVLEPLVGAARFPTTRTQQGYDCEEVDRFLLEVVGSPRPPEQQPLPSVVVEQKGLLGRLFGR